MRRNQTFPSSSAPLVQPPHWMTSMWNSVSLVNSLEMPHGAIPGEHKVVIEAVGEGGMPDRSYFPPEYSDATTTPLTIEVGSRRTFDLQVPKPR